jgi:hypothetical protein
MTSQHHQVSKTFFSLENSKSSEGNMSLRRFFARSRLTSHREIKDDTFLHAFRIFCDKDSGCVRFEATPRRGPLKTIPIWTAFVTQYVGHRGWMKRVGSQTIAFRELHPYMFTDGYKLPKGPSGKYQLTFTTPNGKLHYLHILLVSANSRKMRETSWKPSIRSGFDKQRLQIQYQDAQHQLSYVLFFLPVSMFAVSQKRYKLFCAW